MGKRHYDEHACPKISIYLEARNVVSWYIIYIGLSCLFLQVKHVCLIDSDHKAKGFTACVAAQADFVS